MMRIENRTGKHLLIWVPDRDAERVANRLERVRILHPALGMQTVIAASCPPRAPAVRVSAIRDTRPSLCGIPVTSRRWEPCRESMILPKQPGVVYVVTRTALRAFPGRLDVVAPDWGNAVEADDGKLVVAAFLTARNPAPENVSPESQI